MPIEYRLLPPPYTSFGPVFTREELERKLRFAPGCLLALRPDPRTSEAQAEREILDLEKVVPRLTLILHLDQLDSDAKVRLAAVGGSHGVRGYVVGRTPEPHALRNELTDPKILKTDIPRNLRTRGFPVGPITRAFLHGSCDHAFECRNATALSARLGISVRAVRSDLRESRLPDPGAMHQIVHKTYIAVAIQRGELTMTQLAYQFGYLNPGKLRERLSDVLGYRPSDVRKWLGWAFLLDSALRRAGVSPP